MEEMRETGPMEAVGGIIAAGGSQKGNSGLKGCML
jgi:hypothetical protein